MLRIPDTHDDARAQEWFARLDPVIRQYKLRARPHGVVALVKALNDAGVSSSLLGCRISARSPAKNNILGQLSGCNGYVMLIDGCVLHSHGTVGNAAWKSAHLQSHRYLHASIQPIKTPIPPLSDRGLLPPEAIHRPGQAGFTTIKPFHSVLDGLPFVAALDVDFPGMNRAWSDRLRDGLTAALSCPAPLGRKPRAYYVRRAPADLGAPDEAASLQLDHLARHWVGYGKASASDLLWASATLLNNDEISSRLWCRQVIHFDEQDGLSSDLAIAVSFRRAGARYLAHLGDPGRWGIPEPTLAGGLRDPDYLAVHFDYMKATPPLEWMASYNSSAMSINTPGALAIVKARAPRL